MYFKTDEERIIYLKSIVEVLPSFPGVYQYFNSSGKIIYVGKAKNLKNRVSQYFFNKTQSPKTRVLVSRIYDLKYIVVNSEEDALLLENNLIKQYQPRYNILLKDDKTYPWIVIKKETFPRVFLTRNFVRDGSLYFGPYTSSTQVKYLFEIFKQLFPIRACSLNLSQEAINKSNYKVCLKYHLKSCLAPCIGNITEEDYDVFIDEIKHLLRGNFSNVLKSYRSKMLQYSKNLEFEKAEEEKKKIEKLETFQSHSMVSNVSNMNIDVFGYVDDAESNICYINFLKVVNGIMIQSFTMEFRRKLDETISELLSYAINEVKERTVELSHEIVVPVLPDVEFSELKFTIPVYGDKKKLLELSERNAKMYKLELLRREANKNHRSREEKLLLQIKENLGLQNLPRHIECFDNSNIQGSNAVAACVVFRDCKPCKEDYRLFNIKTVEGPDDYASMYEVVFRRYSRLKNENQAMPDLIIADGGIGQMEVMRQATEEALHLNIPIIGLAKDNKHRTNQILFGFPPKIISIGKNDQVFKFFTQVQDEVHRFAITFHRNKRSKSMTKSELDNIKGIGAKTSEILIKSFKSVAKIKTLSVDQLSVYIGTAKAKIIYEFFHAQ